MQTRQTRQTDAKYDKTDVPEDLRAGCAWDAKYAYRAGEPPDTFPLQEVHRVCHAVPVCVMLCMCVSCCVCVCHAVYVCVCGRIHMWFGITMICLRLMAD